MVRSEVGVQVLIEVLLEQFVFWIIFEVQVLMQLRVWRRL